ncbi:MAG: hypothetical protein IH845_03925 [Nanoarchaeota archaeon]|nr:hypothetical protein [Nanoarchaeota archaeon]
MKSEFEKLRMQYRESTTWTMYFLGLTLSLMLGSISMESTNPSLSTIFLNSGMFIGVMSLGLFMMKEYRYYKVLGFLKRNKL